MITEILMNLSRFKDEIADVNPDEPGGKRRLEKLVDSIKMLLAHGQLNGDDKLRQVGSF